MYLYLCDFFLCVSGIPHFVQLASPWNFITEVPPQVFFCEFCKKFFKITFQHSAEHLWANASDTKKNEYWEFSKFPIFEFSKILLELSFTKFECCQYLIIWINLNIIRREKKHFKQCSVVTLTTERAQPATANMHVPDLLIVLRKKRG